MNQQHPKISIITPSFNQGKYIEDTIVSVISQGYTNLEYILIDGGSTDETIDIVRNYESKINYWVSEKDNGQSQAINKGLKKASGEIIGWLCSDDLYLPGTLDRIAKIFINKSDVVMLHGKSILFGENFRQKIVGGNEKDLQYRYLSLIPFPQPSSFFRRRLIDEQGILDEKLHYAMDFDLLIRGALHYRIAFLKEILSKYRLHDESKSVLHQRHFIKEWVTIFSKFIRSNDVGSKYIVELSACGLYEEGIDFYKHNTFFSESDFKKIVLYYLDGMIHLHYDLFQISETRQILNLTKRIDTKFYRERKLNSIAFRIKHFSPRVLRRIRKIVR